MFESPIFWSVITAIIVANLSATIFINIAMFFGWFWKGIPYIASLIWVIVFAITARLLFISFQ